MIFSLIPALLLPAALGFLILAVLQRTETETSFSERLFLSFPLGLGLLTVQLFLLGLSRVPLTLGIAAPLICGEIAVLFLWARSRKVPLLASAPSRLLTDLRSAGTGPVQRTAYLVLCSWIALKLGTVLIETWLRPLYAWDVWANWSAGAKMFFATNSLMLDVPAQDFFARGVISRIIAYPLNNPLAQVWIALWTGSFDEVLVKFSSPLYFISLTGVAYHIMARETNRLIGLAVTALLLSSPLLSYHAIELYSDLPLSVYLLFSLAAVLRAMRGVQSGWVLAGIFSSQALFTKDESLFLVAPLMLSSLAFLWRTSGWTGSFYRNAARLLMPLLSVVPWFLFKFSHKLALGAEWIKLDLTFHPEVVRVIFSILTSLENFNVFVIFLVVFLIMGGRPKGELLHLLAPVACYGGFFVAIYSLTAYYNLEFNRGTVFYRNVLTAYPAICFLTVLAMRKVMPEDWTTAPKAKEGAGEPTKRQKNKSR